MLQAGENRLTEKISCLCLSRSERWAKDRALKLLVAANRNPFKSTLYQSHLISLDMYIRMLLQYQEHLARLDEQVDALAGEIEEYKIIQTIPGIGGKIAATIISEIGEIERFNHPKKLVAFSGIDPSVHSSGKFTATINRITKRGSSRLCHAYIWLFSVGLEAPDKKREEGKPFKVAMIACSNKLVHWIFALLKSKETFLDLA